MDGREGGREEGADVTVNSWCLSLGDLRCDFWQVGPWPSIFASPVLDRCL